MDIYEQLKENLFSIQEIAQEKIFEITEAKLKYLKSQDFEEAVKISKIETVLIEFISQADKITNFTKKDKRETKIKEIFKNKKNKINKINSMKQVTETQNQALELELIKEFGKGSSLDGILNLEEYNKTTPKILWILKEGNWGEESLGNTDNLEQITELEVLELLKKEQAGMKEYYDNVPKGYSKWKATFKNISYITHGIIERVYKYDDMTDIDNDAKIDGIYYINKVALINVKKAPGGSKAEGVLIAESYAKHKDFILKQIETINPDIIFECSSVSELRNDLAGRNEIDKENNSVVNNGRLIINTYHPMQTQIPHEEYVDRNLAVVKNYFK